MSQASAEQASKHSYPDVIPIIEEWLRKNHLKIQQFWIGADWRLWARYELFTILENAFEDAYLVTHGNPIWDSYNEDEQVDILLEHRDSEASLAIHLRCENVNENCGSFETFSEQYQKDWVLIKDLNKHTEDQLEGTRVMLVGFSGEPIDLPDEIESRFGQLEPSSFKSGEVYAWYLFDDTVKTAESSKRSSS